MKPDGAIARYMTFDISQSIRLLQLKGEMLTLEVQQSKIICCRGEHSRYTEGVDLELGIADPQPVSRIATEAALCLEENMQPVARESSNNAALHAGLAPMTTAEIRSCPPLSQRLLEELSPAREQLLQEMVPNTASGRGIVEAEQSSLTKALPRYDKKKRISAL
ncbi:hypothetical protein Moror_15839 [Moniliophthora roreri MCA 2997]|uniref:Uncharacterized protein n=1 Tax=Moniliophthora roreri (strain MCA 2997) TaxID=1381753 RepID=V2WND2_MONRO|nr:hypothetical protein Moror_15839 [Moniliophthora roreri MCA 2997]